MKKKWQRFWPWIKGVSLPNTVDSIDISYCNFATCSAASVPAHPFCMKRTKRKPRPVAFKPARVSSMQKFARGGVAIEARARVLAAFSVPVF